MPSAVLAIVLAACGGPADEADAPQGPERIETGRGCAEAVVACGVGRCVVDIDNHCKTPVTCQLQVASLCRTAGGEQGPADATSKRVTMLSGRSERLGAAVGCGQGTPVTTLVEAVECI